MQLDRKAYGMEKWKLFAPINSSRAGVANVWHAYHKGMGSFCVHDVGDKGERRQHDSSYGRNRKKSSKLDREHRLGSRKQSR